MCSRMLTSFVGVGSVSQGVGESVGVGAGFDDVAAEGEAIDDGRAEPRISERLGPSAERLVARYAHGGLLLAFGENLEEQLGSSLVKGHVAKLVDAEQVDPTVAGDRLGQGHFVGGFDEHRAG